MNDHNVEDCPVCVKAKQKRRADRDMRARLRERMSKADPWDVYYALLVLVDVVPDQVDAALTEAGVS